MPGVSIIAEGLPGLWNTVAFAPPFGDRTDWILDLEKRGFLIGSGSACSSGRTGSPILDALGIDPSIASRTLRISGTRDHSQEDWQSLLEALQNTAASLGQKRSGITEIIDID